MSNKLKQLAVCAATAKCGVGPVQAVCHEALGDTAFPVTRGSLSSAVREGASGRAFRSMAEGGKQCRP